MKTQNKFQEPNMVWSDVQKKWICYDNSMTDIVLKSPDFRVLNLNYEGFKNRFSVALRLTEGVLRNLPLVHEGPSQEELRKEMKIEIERNSQKGIDIFKWEFKTALNNVNYSLQTFDLAKILINSILKSNLALANINLNKDFDYSDFTLILDDTQSVNQRKRRENKIKEFLDEIDAEVKLSKIALMVIGVNALISSILNSIINILQNKDFEYLKNRKFFYSTGIKSLQRVCISNTQVGGFLVKKGEIIKLMSIPYDDLNLTELQINKKFFGSETSHACQGMAFSLHVWKEIVKVLGKKFSELHIASFRYRNNDNIFAFPTELNLKFRLKHDSTTE